MSTLVSTGPVLGVSELIAGGELHGPVNDVELAVVPPGVPTAIGPGVAPLGTIAWISESESTVKLASTWLNLTTVAPVKEEPRMSTLPPAGPHVGVNELIVGAMPNGAMLLPVPFGVVTVIGPVTAPLGTVAWISESESTVKEAPMPLKVTEVAPARFAPRMSTLVPTEALAGVKVLIAGAVMTAPSTSTSSKFAETPQPPA
jgi:hypothetical protein